MTQLTDIKPPDPGLIVTQFKDLLEGLSLSSARPPFPTFPTPADIISSNFVEPVTGVANTFSNLAENLPTDPQDLLEDLTSELKALGSGSSDISNLLRGLTEPFTQAGTAFKDFQTILTPLTDDLLPALSTLHTQPTNSSALTQLFPIASLAAPLVTQLPAALASQLTQVQSIAALLDDVFPPTAADTPPTILLLSDYEAILTELTTLPLDASLNAEHLSLISEQQVQPLQLKIDALQSNAQTISDQLQTFQQSLAAAPVLLNATIDDILNKLSPQYLAQLGNPLSPVLTSLTSLGDLDLSRAIAQVQSAVIPLQTLV
ncbi:MAG: hypothetical protein ABG776_17580, partial [Cyanobacteria bacterium J06555_13]